MRSLIAFTFSALVSAAFGQSADSTAQKGSYLFWGQPVIEDNSMLIEEAFNQEAGVIQHISNLIVDKGSLMYTYTPEIPLSGDKHQISFTVGYSSIKKQSVTETNSRAQGFGDILVSYRPLLCGKNDWALVIPRFTLIIPTGDPRTGSGDGAWGGQFKLAVTKRITRSITTHYNAGYTYLSRARYYTVLYDQPELTARKDLSGYNWGASAIWSVVPRFNVMLEYVSALQDKYADDGAVQHRRYSYIINPGFRFAFETGKVQIVPGLGIPLNFTGDGYPKAGTFFYLSIEPSY
jgi:hypothetical protein